MLVKFTGRFIPSDTQAGFVQRIKDMEQETKPFSKMVDEYDKLNQQHTTQRTDAVQRDNLLGKMTGGPCAVVTVPPRVEDSIQIASGTTPLQKHPYIKE